MGKAALSMNTMIQKYGTASVKPRHELKFLVSAQDSAILQSRLSGFLRDDANGDGPDGYLVTSLYFDTPYRRCAQDKEDGIHDRTKYRIRTYGSGSGEMRLEKKVKNGDLCFKSSCPLDTAYLTDIMTGLARENETASVTGPDLQARFSTDVRAGVLEPVVIVRYRRRAFCGEPGRLRITFDGELTAQPPDLRLDMQDPLSIPVLPDRSVILEVKFDEILPDAVRYLLQLPGRPQLSLSKYLICLRALPFSHYHSSKRKKP